MARIRRRINRESVLFPLILSCSFSKYRFHMAKYEFSIPADLNLIETDSLDGIKLRLQKALD